MIKIKNLEGDVLRQVDADTLRVADLHGAYLRGAYLHGAVLRGAYLHGADLHGAYLRGADLRGADLHGAYLRGADLRGAYLRHGSVIDAGQDLRGYRFVANLLNGVVMIAAGCRYFTLREAYRHWSAAHADNLELRAECLAKVRLIEVVAKARGWMPAAHDEHMDQMEGKSNA